MAVVCAVVCTVVVKACLLFSQQAPPAETRLSTRLAIKAGRLLDVAGGKVTTGRYIVVENDRIASIADSALVGVPVIDLSSATVLPGLIDCHAHVLRNPKDYSPVQSLRMSSAQGALWGFRNLQVWLDHGFTALRDAGEDDLGYGQLALRDSIPMGLIRGPRMVSAGNYVSLTGGHGDVDDRNYRGVLISLTP
jgi:imidazolonepropionase-like amidohydrolase